MSHGAADGFSSEETAEGVEEADKEHGAKIDR